MYLHVIVAYFLLLWWPERRPFEPLITGPWGTLLFVAGQLPLIWLIANRASAAARRPPGTPGPGTSRAQHLYHQVSFLLSIAAIVGFAADLFLTVWPDLVRRVSLFASVPGLADLVILAPFFASLIVLWIASYPTDRAVREAILRARRLEAQHSAFSIQHSASGTPYSAPGPGGPGHSGPSVWTLGQYLFFNVRHQLLIAAVPMTLILIVFHAARAHRETLAAWLRVPWADQAVLGGVAVLVFVFAPVMLRYIWSTAPLPAGPLRRRLEAMCGTMGLRYRKILVWRSHHMMVNAAVMGVFAPVRYVLLSDAMLDSMSPERIEAVFGHEAGHVRQHHIQYFLLFAVCGMLLVSGIIELLIRASVGPAPLVQVSETTIQIVGFAGVLVVWGVGFGWVSRRFERQADLCGARSITAALEPTAGASGQGCRLPCSRHPGLGARAGGDGLCATAADIFISVLDRVAVLNGIPHDERSWRHSSIRSRMRFLTALAGDPGMLRRFDRLIRRIKTTLWIGSVAGVIFAAVYIAQRPHYRESFLENFVRPFTGGNV